MSLGQSDVLGRPSTTLPALYLPFVVFSCESWVQCVKLFETHIVEEPSPAKAAADGAGSKTAASPKHNAIRHTDPPMATRSLYL